MTEIALLAFPIGFVVGALVLKQFVLGGVV